VNFFGIKRKDISVASIELLEKLGYTPGGVSLIPATDNVKVIIDSKISEYEKIVCGSGPREKH
jgi:prolyl-tRNA editing enzyme YbaK/EbsC (Cys-tRNA(Pro) deacylase)